jgi:nicotinamidase-related amidase
MATAFIGLDFINDIVHPEGKISHTANLAAERGVIEKVNRALATARERGWLTILVKVGFAKGYTDQPKHSPFFGRLHEISALEAEFSGMDEVPIW